MVNSIILGIAEKIRTVFSQDQYGLYTESVEQGLMEPCFFISLINHTQKQQLANRYKETFFIEVVYLPSEDGNQKEECAAVAEGLFELLEYIYAEGDLLRGMNLSSAMKEGVLHFYVDYTLFEVREKMPDANMEEVIIYGETKKW